jgi:hypothetical protein
VRLGFTATGFGRSHLGRWISSDVPTSTRDENGPSWLFCAESEGGLRIRFSVAHNF